MKRPDNKTNHPARSNHPWRRIRYGLALKRLSPHFIEAPATKRATAKSQS